MTHANNTKPILIFGAPRSGTSLLSRLLAAHSRIAIPLESHLFNQWSNGAKCYRDLSKVENQRHLIENIIRFGVVQDWRPRPVAADAAELVRGTGFGAVATGFMEWAAKAEGKVRWGEKTPYHTLLHRQVFEVWRDALVVMIHRDPRDVARSWKQARFGGNHVYPFAKAWKTYMHAAGAARELLPKTSWYTVRYEELVQNPERELTRIMTFLGEDFEPGQLGFHQEAMDWNTDARNRAQLRRPISIQNVGRWETALSPRVVRIVEYFTTPTLEAHGYTRRYPDSNLPLMDRAAVRYVEYPVQRILGIFKNRPGFVYLGRDLNWKARQIFSAWSRTG